MQPFWLYVEIQPTLDRPDVFLATTKFSAEPEPYRDLLLFPEAEPGHVMMVARLHHRLRCRGVPPLGNMGTNEGRYFYDLGLGLAKAAPKLSPVRAPVPGSFWGELRQALDELHQHGFVHGNVREHTIAVTDQGAPVLFDLLSAQPASSVGRRSDWAALDAMRRRVE